MKKRISLVVVLALILSMFAPVTAFGADEFGSKEFSAEEFSADVIVRDDTGKVIVWEELSFSPDDEVNALDALTQMLGKKGISYFADYDGTYITMIDDISAGDKGANSGWMYFINGYMAMTGAGDYLLKNGDIILWDYTLDWASEGDFTDIDSSWAKSDIQFLKALGVVGGVSVGKYAPTKTVTRAEFMQILYNLEGSGEEVAYSNVFADVQEKSWYSNVVLWGYENGLINGSKGKDGNLYFNPSGEITREDMATMVHRYGGDIFVEEGDARSFKDASSISVYAREAVTVMQKNGIIGGVKNADGTYSFKPKESANRAELAKMIGELAELVYF